MALEPNNSSIFDFVLGQSCSTSNCFATTMIKRNGGMRLGEVPLNDDMCAFVPDRVVAVGPF